MSEYPKDYPLAPAGSSLDIVFRAMHEHGFEFGDGQDWQCPVHDDNVPSCGIKAGDSKAVIVSCQQCIQRLESSALFKQSFAAALGLDPDLLDRDPEGAPRSVLLNEGERQKLGASRRPRARAGRTEDSYVYTSSDGNPVMKVDRLIEIRDGVETGRKFFKQYTYTPDMGFVLGLREGVERPLYQLPLLRSAIESNEPGDQPWVHFVEGEKSVAALGAQQLLATCIAGGSNVPDDVLRAAIREGLAGVEGVRIIADNDTAGYRFALRVARAIQQEVTPKPLVEVYRSATTGPADDAVEHFAEHAYDDLVRVGAQTLRKLADGDSGAVSEPVLYPDEAPPTRFDDPEGDPTHWPKPDEPFRVARLFARRRYYENGESTLHHWRGDFYQWDAALNRYRVRSEQSMRTEVYNVLDAGRYWHSTKDHENDSWVPWKPTMGSVTQVLDAMRAAVGLDEDIEEGTWLDGRKGSGYVHFANGHLTVETGVLTEKSPRMFNHYALPFEYDPNVGEPTEWLAFLSSVWPDDEQSISVLQEWFGYVLSGETALQKMLLMRGPTRSGKGTIATVLQSLMGAPACAAPTLNGLAGNFGLQPLIGKSLAVIADARFGGRSETMKTVVERLLTITGEDATTIDRKNKESWFGVLPTRLMVLSNEVPRLIEASDALANRFVILEMTISHLHHEDTGLKDKLANEYPGIIQWALEGLRRLRARGRFTTTHAAEAIRTELMELGAPVRVFVEEKCELVPGAQTESTRVYDAWRMWVADNQSYPLSRQAFGRELHTAFPEVQRVKVRQGKAFTWAYRGIKVKP